MEEKRCKNCGARLLEHETYCPVCNQKVIDEQIDEKSYWLNKKIWLVFIVLFVVTGAMSVYLANNPITVSDKQEVTTLSDSSNLSIGGDVNAFVMATNNNYLGASYVSGDYVYLLMNQQIVKYDRKLSNSEVVIDKYVKNFSEDDSSYFYVDANNDYYMMDKVSKETNKLLTNVYYVQKTGNLVYYQNDSDGETIHLLNIKDNSDVKINDEVSYNIIVDKSKIYYTNKNKELVVINNDGSERKALASNISAYTFDGEYLYYTNSEGLVKSDLEGKSKVIYESTGLSFVNKVDKKLVIQKGTVLSTMNLDGSDVETLYTMDSDGSLAFEVVGDKLFVLSKGAIDSSITYEIISLTGKRQILEDNNYPTIPGTDF